MNIDRPGGGSGSGRDGAGGAELTMDSGSVGSVGVSSVSTESSSKAAFEVDTPLSEPSCEYGSGGNACLARDLNLRERLESVLSDFFEVPSSCWLPAIKIILCYCLI